MSSFREQWAVLDLELRRLRAALRVELALLLRWPRRARLIWIRLRYLWRYRAEIIAFPNDPHIDLVDALSGRVHRLDRSLALIEWKWRLIGWRTRAAALLLRLGLGPRAPYGHMTLDRWLAWGFTQAGAVTLVNGEAVPGLVEFDDVRGIAIAHTTRPPRRHPFLDQVETRLLRGRIRVVFNSRRRKV